MSEKKAVAEKMIVAEIVRALNYLKGVDISAEEKRQIAEEQNYQLIRDAQLLPGGGHAPAAARGGGVRPGDHTGREGRKEAREGPPPKLGG